MKNPGSDISAVTTTKSAVTTTKTRRFRSRAELRRMLDLDLEMKIARRTKRVNSDNGDSPTQAVNPEFVPSLVALCCGTDERLEYFEIPGVAAHGLAVHPIIRAKNKGDAPINRDHTKIGREYGVTHLATGLQICRAHSENAAKEIAAALLHLDADWENLQPWRSRREEKKLKIRVGELLERFRCSN